MKAKFRFLILAFVLLVSSHAMAQNECKPKIGWVPMPCSKHDANLIPENIKTGVTIFGVQGNYPSPEIVEAAKGECYGLCLIPGVVSYILDLSCYSGCTQGVDILFGKLQQ